MLQKIQDDNPNPNSVETLIQVYVTPLEEVVKHFKQLFLVDASKEQDSASPIAKLNEKVFMGMQICVAIRFIKTLSY